MTKNRLDTCGPPNGLAASQMTLFWWWV